MLAAVLVGACAPGAGGETGSPRVAEVAAPSSAAPPAVVAQEAASQVDPRRPLRLALPSGVIMEVDRAATAPGGQLVVPDDISRAGWWVGSSRLGDPFGSMVIAAHVDSFSQGLGPVAELLSATPGATLRISGGGGLAQTFTVDTVTRVPRARLDARSPLFSVAGELRLVVITCGGPYDAERGYRDNVVVVATPAGSLSRP